MLNLCHSGDRCWTGFFFSFFFFFVSFGSAPSLFPGVDETSFAERSDASATFLAGPTPDTSIRDHPSNRPLNNSMLPSREIASPFANCESVRVASRCNFNPFTLWRSLAKRCSPFLFERLVLLLALSYRKIKLAGPSRISRTIQRLPSIFGHYGFKVVAIL